MTFAEALSQPAGHDPLWQTAITVIGGVAIAWLQLRTRAAVDRAGKDATTAARAAAAAAGQAKAAVAEAKSATAGQFDEVKTTLARKSEMTAQTRQDIAEVKAGLEQNTQMTAEVKGVVNGRTDALLDEVKALRKILADHGIEVTK